ncbi:alpha/beta fold hydrolase [Pseudocolwellia sp. AS88]|uniref:alpha/beta hydrolase family protein n=1 Tax=Pseudocolwellia sp. AS88 TaxID=3063958 RepID=UPI0026EFA523|nr:alpha/beta fold hydrolase [Pseudocolwellia sp. AS88]MDO7085243.1 alpha/beta fold hydrolase [Pseudocolwellia sp. AS88]
MKRFSKLYLLCMLAVLGLSNLSHAKSHGEYAASSEELTFESNGKKMSGFIYKAAGKGPHPSVLLLHGYPGNEKNLDVAQALRSKGWNVVFFHYRGAWGSEGEFSFLNAETDVQSVLKYMKNNADKLRIDEKSISLVGHSMGGHLSIAGILDNPEVSCAVAYDGANLGVNDLGIAADPATTIPWEEYSDTLFMLEGWSGEKALTELKENAKALNLVRRVNSLNGRPVLLIPADTAVIPMESHITPLLKALRSTKNSKISYKLISDDHSFNSSREELITTTIDFLESNCK